MLTPADLLYEDDHLMAVAKPPGLPVHATLDPRREHLLAAMAKLDRGPLWLVHRLDVDTSGVVLLAKRANLVATLQALWPTEALQKRYLALSGRQGDPPPSTWEVLNHLAETQRAEPPVHAVRAGGKRAHTRFRTLAQTPKAMLIEAWLQTGRRHQIRVHLADAGLGILGDVDYAPQFLHMAPRLMLHAWQLTMPHPVTQQQLALACPPPDDFAKVAARLGLALPT
jgi:RluA family pseudouridine synthase